MKKAIGSQADFQPNHFTFRDQAAVADILSRYPDVYKASAVMPLLDLAQRQIAEDGAKANPPYGGWIPRVAMDEIARIIEQPAIKVYEVATFYSMYNLAPVGKYLLQLCTTTPCWLRGSDDIVMATKEFTGVGIGETSADGLFTLMDVECLGACVNAPMMQINDDYYEDLDRESTIAILTALKEGKEIPKGSQKGRLCSMPQSGATTLAAQAKSCGTGSCGSKSCDNEGKGA
jgi:NADH dehydrogenase (ubiquinone) flavoprotein 2